MAPKKPFVPSDAEIAVADRVSAVLDGIHADGLDTEALPGTMQASLRQFGDVASVADRIRREQPVLLASYAEDFLTLVDSLVPLHEDDRANLVSGLFGSAAMARLLGDVAAGNIEPVAAMPKRKRASQPATSAPTGQAEGVQAQETQAEAVQTDAVQDQAVVQTQAAAEPAKPARKRTPKKAEVAEAEPAEPAPVADPADEPVAEPLEGHTNPDDFDPFVPAEKPTPAVVPVSLGALDESDF